MKHHLQKILMQGINQFFPFHGREMEKKWTQWQTLISLTPKSLRTVTATIKLKDICSLERKLWQASVQLLSCVWLFATPWTAAHKASLFIINSQSLLKLMSIKLVLSSNHLILYHPLLLPFPASGSFPRSQFFSSGGPTLEFQFHHQTFQWISRTDYLQETGWISLQSKGLSRVFSNTTVQKHQFFGAQLSL